MPAGEQAAPALAVVEAAPADEHEGQECAVAVGGLDRADALPRLPFVGTDPVLIAAFGVVPPTLAVTAHQAA